MILRSASISISASGDNAVIAAVTNKEIRVYRLVLINAVATAQTATIKDAAGGNTLGVFPLPSSIGGGIVLSDTGDTGSPWFVTASGGAFVVNLSAATAVNGVVEYMVA